MDIKRKKIAIILEAAGDAKRYGSNKLLEEVSGGRTMISCILETTRELSDTYDKAELTKVLVTQYDEIAAMAPDFTVNYNHHPELGISLSMQLGIEAAGDVDAYMFCVCDQPGLTAATIERLIVAYEEACTSSDAPIVSLAWQGRMYNPKIFSSYYKDELMALSGDTGGRQIINSHLDNLILVEATSESEVIDIDVPTII